MIWLRNSVGTRFAPAPAVALLSTRCSSMSSSASVPHRQVVPVRRPVLRRVPRLHAAVLRPVLAQRQRHLVAVGRCAKLDRLVERLLHLALFLVELLGPLPAVGQRAELALHLVVLLVLLGGELAALALGRPNMSVISLCSVARCSFSARMSSRGMVVRSLPWSER